MHTDKIIKVEFYHKVDSLIVHENKMVLLH